MSVFKSLVSLAATAGVAGAIAVSPIFTLKAEALTEAQVLEKLSSIPVFTIIDDKGASFTISAPQQPNVKPIDSQQVLPFFLGLDEVQMTLGQLQKSNPEIGKKAKITVVSMASVYKAIRENKDKKLVLEVVPSRADFVSARTILIAQGIAADKVPMLPFLFFLAEGDKQNPVPSFNDANQNGKFDKGEAQYIQFFFDKSELQRSLDAQIKLQPDIAQKTKIQVTSLPFVLDIMMSKENKSNTELEIVTFVPSRASIEYIIKNSKQSNSPQVAPSKK